MHLPVFVNQDCFEFMENLKDESVDSVISDMPYGTTALEFDKVKVDLQLFWQHILRVTKPTAPIVLFSAQPFTTDLINSGKKFWRDEIIWCKTMPTGFYDANRKMLNAHENIEIFSKAGYATFNPQKSQGHELSRTRRRKSGEHYKESKKVTTYSATERYPKSYLEYSNGHGGQPTLHPTQKPLELLVYLVRTYSNKGDTVLDPFAGSASALHACALEGRHGIGCELNPEYYAKAKNRLEAVMNQPKLLELV